MCGPSEYVGKIGPLSQWGASGRNAPTTNSDAPARDLQNAKYKHADQLAVKRVTPYRIHVFRL